MNTIPQVRLARSLRLCGTRFALLAGGLAADVAASHAVQTGLQPLLPGKWRGWPQGGAYDVQVAGNHAYVALDAGGLAVFDVSNPTNFVEVGGCTTSRPYYLVEDVGVAVSGNCAYLADAEAGLHVTDMSDPTHCVRVGGIDTSGAANDMAVSVPLSPQRGEGRGEGCAFSRTLPSSMPQRFHCWRPTFGFEPILHGPRLR